MHHTTRSNLQQIQTCIQLVITTTGSAHATTGHEPHLRGLGAATDGGRQAGVYYGPDAMLGGVQLALEDKRAAVEYDVEADGKAQPGTTWPNCQVGVGCVGVWGGWV